MANTGVVWEGRPHGEAKAKLDPRRKIKSELENFISVHCIGVKMRSKWVYKELAKDVNTPEKIANNEQKTCMETRQGKENRQVEQILNKLLQLAPIPTPGLWF
ncbi:hypothetical protein PAAG_11650 [Paracoccidioides lutzii Pb01]|uniref:Uncharacterized protein n=1 Tax=Paracoccidioides lutzii (strain ATCC MYA-826 / Pb01) TaxID=502779 RepID=A0A0A2VLF9_PARBA|nr:hypothetical protein PAAG_11650 [Paracoccidioides lutzii Pb01]KGQ01659.1 hypothetical protein PAAG_11650 [Paracoccidioides lutzii Pb01]